jgi:16S rRNA processing protein RimM
VDRDAADAPAMPQAPAAEELTELGVLGKAFQLAGGLRFYPAGEAEAEALLGLREVVLEGVGPVSVRDVREVGGGLILYLTRALTREAARGLVNRRVYGPASALPAPAEDDILVDELPGLPVLLDGQPYGEVADVLEAGAQDILIVRHAGREVMVPLQAPYVVVTDEDVRLEDVPAGLLD